MTVWPAVRYGRQAAPKGSVLNAGPTAKMSSAPWRALEVVTAVDDGCEPLEVAFGPDTAVRCHGLDLRRLNLIGSPFKAERAAG